jgi:hypothetical protein
MPSSKPNLNPTLLASSLFQFLEWANDEERNAFGKALFDLANNACPQGTAGKVAFLAEASEWIAEGGVRQAEVMVKDASESLKKAATRDEREEIKGDLELARHLLRLISRNQKRARVTFEDISQQVPIF